ncbi:MAG: DUF922 domain-containing protein [Crocinitomix sp.]|nr:DUF922 domain-containing protein [Crocinitomix sp.]
MRNTILPILIFGLLFVSTAFGQADSNIIVWGERPLEWKDFSGPIEQGSEHIASTRSQLRAPNSWNSDSLTMTITAEFIKDKSWVNGSPSDNLLHHEQLHFDITEYHARLFRKTMANHRFKSYDNVAAEVTALFNERFKIYQAMQALYDNETNHSKNLQAQVEWNIKVAGLLEITNDYKAHTCKVYIGYLK